ncbi:MAG: GFA family protein [Gammaproteobacteria bacterium]
MQRLPEPAMSTRAATCSCGQLTATVAENPVRVSVCHCLACQRRTGSVFGAQARFRSEAVQITGESRQYTRVGDEGGESTFSFCPVCGATVYYQMKGHEGSIAIPVGAFAEPDFPSPTFSAYEERKHSWVVMPQGIEHMA